MKKVFITIVSFNSNKLTLDCLKSIEKLNKKNIELFVIVIDNASDEIFKTSEDFKNFKLDIIRSEENLGFSGGQNLAIKYALKKEADYVLVLNSDTIAQEDLVLKLLDAFDDNVGIVSPKIYFAKGREFQKDKYEKKDLGNVIWYAGGVVDWKNIIAFHRGVDEVDKGQYDQLEEIDFASGCAMMIKQEVFERIGFFDERFFLYYEDNDFSQRAKKRGYKILYQPSAILWHKNASSAGGSGSNLQDYYISRNRLLFGFRYASKRSKAALMKESFKLLINGRKWQKRGVIDFYLRNLGKGSYKV